MSDTMLASTRAGTPALPGRLRFSRIAGVAGLFAVIVGFAQVAFVGDTPGLGDSAAEVTAYFARDGSGHKIGVVISALLAIPIALFFVGVYRLLIAAERTHESGWAPLFLFGAIMMSATAGLSEGLFAIPVLREGAGLAPDTLRALNDGSLIARASVGVWTAVAVGGLAAATFQHRIRAQWYGWFCALVAILGVLSVIDSVSTGTGGLFGNLAFFAGFILWTVVTSILMLRDKA
jgi:hypothetical protein